MRMRASASKEFRAERVCDPAVFLRRCPSSTTSKHTFVAFETSLMCSRLTFGRAFQLCQNNLKHLGVKCQITNSQKFITQYQNLRLMGLDRNKCLQISDALFRAITNHHSFGL